MAGKILAEIKQRKPLGRAEEEAYVNLQRTADKLAEKLAAVLKPFGLSPAQYNVLRILRGAEPAGRSCGEISERMTTRDPDITRLLDRLETRGLAARSRHREDRRVVTTRITRKGLKILKDLDEPVSSFHKSQLMHLGAGRLHLLIELLELAREGAG